MVYFFGILWIMFGVVIAGFYCIIIFLPTVPDIIKDLFFYGKVKNKVWSSAWRIEIPKRSFLYFYFIGAVVNGTLAMLIFYCYLNHVSFPFYLNLFLEWMKSNKPPSQNNISILTHTNVSQQPDTFTPIILSTMMFVQNTRRFLECRHISVYSPSTINLIHFILSVFLYTSFPILILSDTILPQSYNGQASSIQTHHIAGVVLFIFSSYHHYSIHKAFAKLRTDKKGNIKTLKHVIPSGHWLFNFVSCPHYLLEIIIYTSFCTVDAFKSFNLTALFFFVLSNQLVAAHMTHKWYLKKFKDYPTNRKAIIPFLL